MNICHFLLRRITSLSPTACWILIDGPLKIFIATFLLKVNQNLISGACQFGANPAYTLFWGGIRKYQSGW